MTDICSRTDIETLVDKFYDKAKVDPLLQSQFAHVDWSKHLPVMYAFWSSMLNDGQPYTGNPFQKHIHLPLTPEHFTAWLKLFHETVDENFKGEKAEEIKMRASSMAHMFQSKMGLNKMG